MFSDDTHATLEQFIDYITTVEGVPHITEQEHWRPITDYCHPCSVNYDVIMHTETLDEDLRYVRQLLSV